MPTHKVTKFLSEINEQDRTLHRDGSQGYQAQDTFPLCTGRQLVHMRKDSTLQPLPPYQVRLLWKDKGRRGRQDQVSFRTQGTHDSCHYQEAEQAEREEIQPQAQMLVYMYRGHLCRHPCATVLHPPQAWTLERTAYDRPQARVL